jgi:hypothetical protein
MADILGMNCFLKAVCIWLPPLDHEVKAELNLMFVSAAGCLHGFLMIPCVGELMKPETRMPVPG